MIPPFIEICGRRNGKQIERDIIGSMLYSNEFMRERGVVIVTEEKPKLYVMMCFNSITADTRLRQFVKKNFPWVKQSKFGAGGFKAIMHNGDEYHFVPASQFDRWMIGRHPDYVISENEVEREEKMTSEYRKTYEEVRKRYCMYGLYEKTDAGIIVAQEDEIKKRIKQVESLTDINKKQNDEIKDLNEQNKKLKEEIAKLKSGSAVFEMPIIEYHGIKFKATRLVIDESGGTRRTIHIDGTMVSE